MLITYFFFFLCSHSAVIIYHHCCLTYTLSASISLPRKSKSFLCWPGQPMKSWSATDVGIYTSSPTTVTKVGGTRHASSQLLKNSWIVLFCPHVCTVCLKIKCVLPVVINSCSKSLKCMYGGCRIKHPM